LDQTRAYTLSAVRTDRIGERSTSTIRVQVIFPAPTLLPSNGFSWDVKDEQGNYYGTIDLEGSDGNQAL
jgi:hypothetical protein